MFEQMEGKHANWDNETTKILLELCMEEKDKNNFPNQGPTTEGWTNMVGNFIAKAGVIYKQSQLQTKLNNLKKKYREWKDLQKRTRLRHDKRTGGIAATNEWLQTHYAVRTLLLLLQFFKIVHLFWSYDANHAFPCRKPVRLVEHVAGHLVS